MYSKKFGEPTNVGCGRNPANGEYLKWQYRVNLYQKGAESMFSQNIKKVIGFDDYYVGDDGIIYSTKKNGGYSRDLTPMKLREDKDGYLEVGMYKDGKRYFRRAHRVVAEAFIPNPKHLPQINHKDGNVKNNNVDNLEWCTCQDNLLHSFRVLKRKPSITTAKIIKLTNKQTKETLYFSTEKDCAFYLNMSYEHLNKLLTGYHDMDKWKKGKLYKVEYSDIEDVTTIPKGSTE